MSFRAFVTAGTRSPNGAASFPRQRNRQPLSFSFRRTDDYLSVSSSDAQFRRGVPDLTMQQFLLYRSCYSKEAPLILRARARPYRKLLRPAVLQTGFIQRVGPLAPRLPLAHNCRRTQR